MTPEWEVAEAAVEQAMVADRVWMTRAEARIARLKYALALEHAGKTAEAAEVIEEVRRDQEQEREQG